MEVETPDLIQVDHSQPKPRLGVEKQPSNRTFIEKCPVCHSRRRSILTDRLLISDNPLDAPYQLRVAECLDCSHRYQIQIWDDLQLRQYYEKDTPYYRPDYVGIPKSSLLRFNSVLRDLAPYLRSDWYHLDVGGYSGHFCNFISPHLEESHCLDISNKIELGLNGTIKIICETLLDYAGRSSEHYDFISLNHTLEHLSDLQQVLASLKALLRTDGYILIEVPDDLEPTDSIIDFTLDHTHYFSSDSLLKFLDADFEIRVFRHFCYGEHSDVGNGFVYRVIARKKHENDTHLPGIKEENTHRIIKSIEQKAYGTDELYVWGAGYHTRLLFSSSELIHQKTVRLIDSDQTRAGKILFGKKIIHPSELGYQDEAQVIISSFDYRDEIEDEARQLFAADHIINPYL